MLYQNSSYDNVWYGVNVVKDYMVTEINKLQARKILIATTNSVTETHSYKELIDILKAYSLLVWKSKQHAPIETLIDHIQEIKEFNPDLIISVGGGSSIDSAKILSFMLVHDLVSKDDLIRYSNNKKETLELQDPLIPHFTIPTTLSAAEYTSAAGFSLTLQNGQRHKQGLLNKNMSPDQIFLDPVYSVETSIDFWISTGIRGIDHAVETVYSPLESPANEALALESLRYLFVYLPLCKNNPSSMNYRLKCQLGAWFSFFSAVNIKIGLSHMIGHQLGAFFDIPHGVTSAIVLPNVMEFMQPYTLKKQVKIYDALSEAGVTEHRDLNDEGKALHAQEKVREFVSKLNVPHKLRDFNVKKESLPYVIKNIISEIKIKNHTLLMAVPNLEERLMSILVKSW